MLWLEKKWDILKAISSFINKATRAGRIVQVVSFTYGTIEGTFDGIE